MASNQRNLERERHWRAILQRQQSSGLSIRAFCKREGVREPGFYAWRKTLRARDAACENPEAGVPPFVEAIVTSPSTAKPNTIAIELERCTLRLDASTSAARIAELVGALEAVR